MYGGVIALDHALFKFLTFVIHIMSEKITEVIEVLKRNSEDIGKDEKYAYLLPALRDEQAKLETVLKKAKKIENGSYFEWVVHPLSEISGKTAYERSLRIAYVFSPDKVFTLNDYLSKATSDEEKRKLKKNSFDRMQTYGSLLGTLSLLHIKGFLDRRNVPTKKKDTKEYRINKDALALLKAKEQELGKR